MGGGAFYRQFLEGSTGSGFGVRQYARTPVSGRPQRLLSMGGTRQPLSRLGDRTPEDSVVTFALSGG